MRIVIPLPEAEQIMDVSYNTLRRWIRSRKVETDTVIVKRKEKGVVLYMHDLSPDQKEKLKELMDNM